jgi:hypothetical protein
LFFYYLKKNLYSKNGIVEIIFIIYKEKKEKDWSANINFLYIFGTIIKTPKFEILKFLYNSKNICTVKYKSII